MCRDTRLWLRTSDGTRLSARQGYRYPQEIRKRAGGQRLSRRPIARRSRPNDPNLSNCGVGALAAEEAWQREGKRAGREQPIAATGWLGPLGSFTTNAFTFRINVEPVFAFHAWKTLHVFLGELDLIICQPF